MYNLNDVKLWIFLVIKNNSIIYAVEIPRKFSSVTWVNGWKNEGSFFHLLVCQSGVDDKDRWILKTVPLNLTILDNWKILWCDYPVIL